MSNSFPNELYHFNEIKFSDGSSTDISTEKINQWIDELIDELSSDSKTVEMSCSSGNTWVCVTKKDGKENEYSVIVAKNYWSGTVKNSRIKTCCYRKGFYGYY